MKIKRLLIATIALLPCLAAPQFDFGSQSAPKPWDSFELNKKTTVRLDFRNANVDNVIAFYSKTSGITIVKDPALTGTITLTSAKAVPLTEAFQILSSTLKLKNFEIVKEGNLLVIQQVRQRGGGFSMTSMSPEDLQRMLSGGGNSELRVYQLQYANATQVARVINEVFAQNQQNPFQQFAQMMMGGGGQGGRNQRGNFGQFGRGGGSTQTVRASADDYSNTVIVNAPSRDHEQVARIIREIDKDIEQPQKPRVYPLKYANANDLVPIVQNILITNAPKGRGGQGSQTVPIDQRFGAAMRTGNFQAAFGTVLADARTNSLVVTATESNLAILDQVLQELDQEVAYESATFVIPLDNARADQMAQLLSQAFGTRGSNTRTGAGFQGFGGTNRNTQNPNNRNLQNPNNRNFGNTGGGGGRGGNIEQLTDELYLQLEDPDAEAGPLATEVQIQGGQLGRLFGGQGTQGGGAALGRNQEGQIVNVRDLGGQVTVIADPNTNSLIVVTNPENEQTIRSILEQLDRIPEQVMIETMIIEATLDKSSQFGVEWKFAHKNIFGTSAAGDAEQNFGLEGANPPLQGFRYSLTSGDLTAFINLLRTDNKFQVLSTPRIFTSNNVQAEINISQRVPYVLSTREDPNGNLTFNYAFEDVGIILTVTPRITRDGTVTMDITQTANDLQGFTSFNAPIINQRSAQTTVSVKDGETIILGGIIRNTVTASVKKVPLLGDIPLLGELFRSTSKQDVKTELLVFLTPRIVRDPAEAAKLREDEEKRLSAGVKKKLDEAKKSGAAGGNGNKGGNRS